MAVNDRDFTASNGDTWIAARQRGTSSSASGQGYRPKGAKKPGIQFRCDKTREARFLSMPGFDELPNSDEFQKASEDQLVKWWEAAPPS